MIRTWVLSCVLLTAWALQFCSPADNKPHKQPQKLVASSSASSSQSSSSSARSSAILPIRGNVYPEGLYYVALYIGNPPKPYFLDVDTGSDLTWLQCDAPCVSCSPAPHPLYKPTKNLVPSTDPICSSLQSHRRRRRKNALDRCDYDIEYADRSSSRGYLVRDVFSLRFANGSILPSLLVLGCGYDQRGASAISPSSDGVLGLGNGKPSILSQLRDQGLTRNVIGHCLSGQGGGYLFFGDDYVPSSGVIWTPMSDSIDGYYSPGPATLAYGKRDSGFKDLPVVFDSGSSYSYFTSAVYQYLINAVKQDLSAKLEECEDNALTTLCWKGPFKSVLNVKKYFKPIVLSFTNRKKIKLEMPPEAYLIISVHGNICLGILNGTEIELPDFNMIGDISMQNLMVVYDNEKKQIGWAPTNCDRLPKSRIASSVDDGFDDGFKNAFSQHYTASMGILTDEYRTGVGRM